ncbi:phage tail protein [Alteribacillus sp. YIM 98480]|uniref:phage tail protein n=1 Tax=Alteribacillus sp. YIM 98480 TaxID=2606599 RepID=UPI00131DBC01|nr:phage tail protein [Alteribacillus sp. YIM 98480]
MIVTDLEGNTERLADYQIERKRKVNSEHSLTITLYKTKRNEHSFDLAVEEALIEYDDREYRIKKVIDRTHGRIPIKVLQADLTFFDLVDEYQYDTISGSNPIQDYLDHALEGTDYTYEVIDSFNSERAQNFGEDTALALVQDILNRFGAEIEIDGTHLRFYQQIGRKTDIQFRYKHNIKTIEREVDTSNLSTYIKGFGGEQNDDGTYPIEEEYTSDMADVYGIRHAPPVYDERFTTSEGMQEHLENIIEDTPKIKFKIEAVELLHAGVDTEQLEIGDELFVIYEPLDIDITARVIEITDYPEQNRSAVFTLSNFENNVTQDIADFNRTKQQMDSIFEGRTTLPYNVLDSAVKNATEALTEAETELNFEDGIQAIDPDDPNRVVVFNSAGMGISDDGGASFSEAITADGFVLSAGAIGQLAANNIRVGADTTYEDDNYNPSIKKRVFVNEPTTPYDEGDLWADGQTLHRSTVTRSVEESFDESDWDKVGDVTELNTAYDTQRVDGEDANTVKDNAKNASDQVEDWKYTGTTLIDGGNIYADTLAAITATLGSVYSGFIEGSTFRTSEDAPYTLIESDGKIVSASSDTPVSDGGDGAIGISIDPEVFSDDPFITFHAFANGDSFDGSGDAFIRLYGDTSDPDFDPVLRVTSWDQLQLSSAIDDYDGIRMMGSVNVDDDFSVDGSKNAIVPSSIGDILINAYETAEYYFGDIGRAEVVEGACTIEIDPLFKETVNTDIDYEVFLTPRGKGLIYVADQDANSFTVEGDDIPFSYEIKAKRKGYEDVRLESAGGNSSE